jgi:hypothetical protein
VEDHPPTSGMLSSAKLVKTDGRKLKRYECRTVTNGINSFKISLKSDQPFSNYYTGWPTKYEFYYFSI